MTLILHAHPLSSYCWKALIALYEHDTPFEFHQLDLGDPESAGEFAALWPLAKMPALVDNGRLIVETSVIVEYLDLAHPGPQPFIPSDGDKAIEARMLDRIFDNYVMAPMQKIVFNRFCPAEARNAHDVMTAHSTMEKAYGWLETRLSGREWAVGDVFSLADCAAGPSLHYADKVQPMAGRFPRLKDYLARLERRPSFARVLKEAEPYSHMFPAAKWPVFAEFVRCVMMLTHISGGRMDRKRFWRRRQRKPKSVWRRAIEWTALLLAAIFGSITAAPSVLAWPYHSRIGSTEVYSEAPIPPEMEQVLERSDRLLAQSPLRATLGKRAVFLTDGGWRWNLLALSSRKAFALRRPFRDAVIVNRSDVAADRIEKDGAGGATRSLSGTLAHEFTHILVARRYGELRAIMLPQYKSEGFADYVAQESSLSEEDYRQLKAAGKRDPAMIYYEGRKRVAAELRRNNGDPDALFAD